jgi:hypothetical protein
LADNLPVRPVEAFKLQSLLPLMLHELLQILIAG